MRWFSERNLETVMWSLVAVSALALIDGHATGQCGEQELLASDGAAGDLYGYSLSITGSPGNEVAIVGARGDDDNGSSSGSAYIYRRSGASWVEEQKLLASDGTVGDLFGHSVSITGTPGNEVAIVGAWSDADNGLNSGSAYIFRKTGAMWIQEAKLLASDGVGFDEFGFSVSITGTPGNEVAIVGAYRRNDAINGAVSGSAYIYRFNGTTWVEEQKLLASDGATFDQFGVSVSISGTSGNEVAVVGAYQDGVPPTGPGSAYIYRFNGATWDEEQKLLASDGAVGDLFGQAVSISGAPGNEIAIVGAYQDADNGTDSGSAYIFRKSGATWVQEAKLFASDGAAGDRFGWSVSISGTPGIEVVIVGAYLDDDNGSFSGSAYTYRFNGLNWVNEVKHTASDGAASDVFGFSVSIRGDVAVVAALNGDGLVADSGSAYVLTEFILPVPVCAANYEQKLLACDGAAGDVFGGSVSITGTLGNEVAIVGARNSDNNGQGSGSAYIYRRSGAIWFEEAKLLASDVAGGDQFGSVSITGTLGNEVAIVGAHANDDNGGNSGSAYIYRWNGVSWVEEQKLLASDGAVSDRFGWSVSITGTPGNEVAIVGAFNDAGTVSGAAYIFRFNGVSWVEEQKLLASDGAVNDRFGYSVSISGTPGNEVAIVGAFTHDDNGLDSGSAYIYRFNGVSWVEEQKLIASDGAESDWFGHTVSVSGTSGNEIAIVGSRLDDDNGTSSGSVYVYRKSGEPWVEEAKLLASDGAAGDQFGYYVSISGTPGNEVTIVGAWRANDNGFNSGSAYIYRFNGAIWFEEAKLLASDGAAGDSFGNRVSITGTSGNEIAIVGASSGSAYIFTGFLSDDCNNNGISDYCDILDASSPDTNTNGIPDECEAVIDAGQAIVINPSGSGSDPVIDTLVDVANITGAAGSTISVIETNEALNPGAGGYSVLGTSLVVDTTMADGEFFMTLTIPFDLAALGGQDWRNIDLVYFNTSISAWEPAVAGNTANSPGFPGPVGDRFETESTSPIGLAGLSNDLGDYGVVWNPTTMQGFAWANVDHATDFSFGVNLCLADTNIDGSVNVTDLLALLAAWGPNPGHVADINDDGNVNVTDLLALLAAWGACP